MLNRERQNRPRDYKKGIDSSLLRQKREENAVRIRKNKREENLAKKRNVHSSFELESDDPSLEELPTSLHWIFGNDPDLWLQGTINIRKVLSIEQNPPIQKVIDDRAVPRLVQFLTSTNYQLQFEAAWALTNVASGTTEQARTVLDANAVPIFVHLLGSPNDDVREQAVWALGNIAGDSTDYRDFVLANNAMPGLLAILSHTTRISMLRNATWTLSNFCRGKPPADWDQVKSAVGVIPRLLVSPDDDVIADALWTLSYLSDGTNDRIQAVIDSGVCKRVIELLLHHSPDVQTPALRTVGNIVTGDDLQTQVMLDLNLLSSLRHLLSHSKKGIRKETCWTLSNITAGNPKQIQSVIDADLFPGLIELLQTASDFETRKEAAWAIANATSGGKSEQIDKLVQLGCIRPMCDLLDCPDSRIILVALENIDNILKTGEENGSLSEYLFQIDQEEGVEKLEFLQNHASQEVYDKAVAILEKYFHAFEDEDQNLAPNIDSAAKIYQFSQNSGGSNPKFNI
eukprot:TRINITY_DN3330_c0_g1_i1.p1 TRINITY_DN3330_c0_g1~~TRINITY_DN3330_c0_g1_i1.p1  ORF type:complete len:535 (+),score=109.97 TRINITY_DN3330_c0_g1_i1:64-1605(+)